MGEVIYLDVPYKEKDIAKELGAKWNHEIKLWYIESHLNKSLFNKWLKEDDKNIAQSNESPNYIFELELDTEDQNYKVYSSIVTDSDLTRNKYVLQSSGEWLKVYYLNFHYWDSRYPNKFDQQLKKLIQILKDDLIIDKKCLKLFLKTLNKSIKVVPATEFKITKKNKKAKEKLIYL